MECMWRSETSASRADDLNSDASETASQREYKRLAEEINGKHLRIGTIENFPYSWVERSQDGRTVGSGVAFEIIEILRDKFNFTFEVVTPANNWEGTENRLEASLLGLVNESEVDMAAAFLPQITGSVKVTQFSPWLMEGTWVMMLKRPTESAAGSGLLAPFEQYVWYLILVAVLSYGPCITLLTHLRYQFSGRQSDKPVPLSPSMWFVYGSFVKQGTTLAPEANSTRVMFATWWLFIILLSSFYTANLTAFLTLSKFTLDIEDPRDLYKKNYRWTAVQGSAVEYVVTDPDEDLFYLNKKVTLGRGFFRAITNNKDFLPDISSGVVLVQDKVSVDYAMYEDYLSKVHKGIPENDRCTFVVTSKYFMKKMRAFAYPRNSTLNNLFDPVLQKIVEAGTITHLLLKTLPTTKICPLDLQSKERRLRNSDLTMTYIVAAIGISAAAAVFIGEMFIRRCYSVKIKVDGTPWLKSLKPKIENMQDDSQPPPYDSIFGLNSQYKKSGKRKVINGRDYYVVNTISGDVRLIPVRTPSAFLFRSK